jgi:cell division protein FtsB
MSEPWLVHIKRLAEDKAKLQIEVRNLRLETTALRDEVEHLQKELARQNARIITMSIQNQVDQNDWLY